MNELTQDPRNAAVSAILARRKLGTRDQRVQQQLRSDPGQLQADMLDDLRPSNMLELMDEIQRTKDPRARATLMEEARRITNMKESLIGHTLDPQLPPGTAAMQAPVYEPEPFRRQPGRRLGPATPLPRVTGGWM